jgi:hypothetical protein
MTPRRKLPEITTKRAGAGSVVKGHVVKISYHEVAMDVLTETYAIVMAAPSVQQAARSPACVTGRIG